MPPLIPQLLGNPGPGRMPPDPYCNSFRPMAIKKPHLAYALLEFRAPMEALALSVLLPLLKKAPQGDGQPVLVLPGFMTGDNATFMLRRYLEEQGFSTLAWELGRNPGLRQDVYLSLERRVDDIYAKYGQKVSIVGWSLGGLYARILGHRLSSKVRQVITIGTPFALDSKVSMDEVAVSGPILKLYHKMNPNIEADSLVNGEPVWESPPPVPSSAIYSEDDGVASWRYCIDDVAERTENIRIVGSHMGLTHNPLVLYALADRLAQPVNQWRPFHANGYFRFFYLRSQQQRVS